MSAPTTATRPAESDSKEPAWVAKLTNFAIQYNLTCASTALAVIEMDKATQEQTTGGPKKNSDSGALPPEPAWASQFLLAAVFGGTLLGMLTMGWLGDRIGVRKAMAVTMAVTLCGAVVGGLVSIAVVNWLGGAEDRNAAAHADPAAAAFSFYMIFTVSRFVLGVGVGGMYPLSAASSVSSGDGDRTADGLAGEKSEAVSEGTTARKAGLAFLWQTPGVCAPYVVCSLLTGFADELSVQAKFMWIVGMGALPCACVFANCVARIRNEIPGSGGGGSGGGAAAAHSGQEEVVAQIASSGAREELAAVADGNTTTTSDLQRELLRSDRCGSGTRTSPDPIASTGPAPRDPHRLLLGTGGTWFLFDVSFYGTSVFAPFIIEKILPKASLQAVCLQTIGSNLVGVLGSLLSVWYIGRKNCREALRAGFFVLAVCFLVFASFLAVFSSSPAAERFVVTSAVDSGGEPRRVETHSWFRLARRRIFFDPSRETTKSAHSSKADIAHTPPASENSSASSVGMLTTTTTVDAIALFLYYLLLVACNFGPNVATYVLPMICFEKANRVTFHGRSAACGKAGAFLGTLVYPLFLPVIGVPGIMLVQSVVSACGLLVAHVYVPDDSRSSSPSSRGEIGNTAAGGSGVGASTAAGSERPGGGGSGGALPLATASLGMASASSSASLTSRSEASSRVGKLSREPSSSLDSNLDTTNFDLDDSVSSVSDSALK